MSDFMKVVFKGLKKEVLYFAGAALKSGAANISQQLLNVTNKDNQSSGLQLGTISNALKSGIMATGQDLMTVGVERVKSISPQDRSSSLTKESTQTQQSEEEN